jgi:SAM-dependent methyltransferase
MMRPTPRRPWAFAVILTLLLGVLPAMAQAPSRRPDVVYVPTPHHVVDAMLRLAEVTKDDVVYDLGCGDGRVVIAAARQYGARGVGVDIDPQRIQESRANARSAGVAERVRFLQQDLFTTDIREATVVTLYLLPRLNIQLRPKLLSELRPGTRVVSHAFAMEDWRPDQQIRVPGSASDHLVYFWVVPADVAGTWRWRLATSTGEQHYTLRLQQRFQDVDGALSVDGEATPIAQAALTGDRLRFAATLSTSAGPAHMWFDGRVSGNRIQGQATLAQGAATAQYRWTASRSAAPTPSRQAR